MLSSDFVTEFRDKATNIKLSPLPFEEYYGYVGGSATEAIYSYMQYGGMPLAVLKSDEERICITQLNRWPLVFMILCVLFSGCFVYKNRRMFCRTEK